MGDEKTSDEYPHPKRFCYSTVNHSAHIWVRAGLDIGTGDPFFCPGVRYPHPDARQGP